MKKLVVVTGCSSGIGLEISNLLRDKDHYEVVGISRTKGSFEAGLHIEADLSVSTDLVNVVDKITKLQKPISSFIHCAAVMISSSSSTINAEELEYSFRLNVCAPIFLTSALTKPLAKGRATVIFLGSIASELNIKGELIYSSTKAALSQANQSFAAELSRLGIKYIEVSPGICQTPMTAELSSSSVDFMKSKSPFKRCLSSVEVAQSVVKALDLDLVNSGSKIYVGGIVR